MRESGVDKSDPSSPLTYHLLSTKLKSVNAKLLSQPIITSCRRNTKEFIVHSSAMFLEFCPHMFEVLQPLVEQMPGQRKCLV